MFKEKVLITWPFVDLITKCKRQMEIGKMLYGFMNLVFENGIKYT